MPEPQDDSRSRPNRPSESELLEAMRVLDGLAGAFVTLDREWRYTHVNAEAERMFGLPRSDLFGRCVWDLFPFIVGTEMERQMRRAADEQVTCEFQGNDSTGERFYENKATPTQDGGVAVYFRDITDRKLAEERLRRSEALLAEAQELAHVGSWNWDLTTDLLTWSDEHYRIFGMERQAGPMTFERGISVIHPDDLPRVRRTVDKALRGREPYECSLRLLRPDDSVRFVHSRGRAVYDHDGHPIRMYGTVQDVTERTRAEEALRQVNTRVELALRGSDIGIWESEFPEGTLEGARVVFTNVWEHLGYKKPASTPDFAAGASLIHPDERDRMRDALRAYLSGESPTLEFEHRVRRADGSYRWMLNRGVAIREAEGKSVRVIGSRVDITEHRRAEEALRESETRFQVALSASPGVVVFSQDMGLRYTWAHNSPLGVTAEDVLGKTDADFFNQEDAARITAIKRRVLHSGVRAREEVTVTREETRAFDLTVEPLLGPSGQVAGIICVGVDITDRKRLEEALLRAKEAAEAANRSKDEFLANVSHEIRTPFGSILGMTELILGTPLTDDQRQCLQTVKSAADSLLGLVDDLLDFEKIEAGRLELAPADLSLRAAMADTLQALTVWAHAKGLDLTCKVEPDVPDSLVGDAGRLRQVLLNLVGNAIKFTRHGEVAVRVEVAEGPAPNEEAVLRFTVRDTGIGIPPDGRERIFRAFEQADSSTTREFGGTGLGLTIAARLVALMGGKIAVESEPGLGSTFAFTARFGRRPHPPEPVTSRPSDEIAEAATPARSVAPLRILVAEDNEFNVRHLQRLLGKQGHHVRLAKNGREALGVLGIEGQGLAVERPLAPDFDVLLLDLHMPELDGFDVIRAIREREKSAGGHLPVIALTARSRQEDRENCLTAGMDDYLAKPIRAEELFSTIDRVVSAHGVSRATQPDTGDRFRLLDPVVLLATCGHDEEGLREMCQDFRALTPARIAEVYDALRAGDAPRLRESAHKLGGLLSAFSTVAGEVASNLEGLAAGGRLVEAAPLVERLETMAQELARHLEGLSTDSLRRRAATEGP